MHRFLKYFTYHSRTSPKKEGEATVYHQVTFLQPIGKYKKGDTADAVSIQLEFYIYEGDEIVEEAIVLR